MVTGKTPVVWQGELIGSSWTFALYARECWRVLLHGHQARWQVGVTVTYRAVLNRG